ncbi:MAG: thymidylate synthase, partial [Treponema sp.]|nr:thymidylate synthase [Treponema sp.]
MSYADRVFIENCREILKNGYWDKGYSVRPHWDDGAPAHTVKSFCLVNRYDLGKEFPIMTLRKMNF